MGNYLSTGEKRILGRMAEMEGLRADGKPIPIELSVTRMPRPGPVFTAILRDFTERRVSASSGEAGANANGANLRAISSPTMVDDSDA